MSANERFGCLGNWKRLAFDRHDPLRDPAVYISTVVNNRADRVARSRVFASVLVNDLGADRHFLIGGNLKGLQGFIWEAWAEFERTISLHREGGAWDLQYARTAVRQYAQRFRVHVSDDQVRHNLRTMIKALVSGGSLEDESGLGDELPTGPQACAEWLRARGVADTSIERLTHHLDQWLQQRREFDDLLAEVDRAHGQQQQEQVAIRLRKVLREWFARKLVVIENYNATGEEILQRIVDATPPGFLNRVMGIQNIKGTGLDFVYRFHAWDTCHQACQLLDVSDQDARAAALNALENMPEYGLLCQLRLEQTLEKLRHVTPPLSASQQIQLDAIQAKLAESVQSSQDRQLQSGNAERSANRPWLGWVTKTLEQWMEVNDAVRRRKRADQIYRDLQSERISRQRAVEELRHLNKRQKGGWLADRLLGGHH